jgi:hydrogenase/urease accessory protein HupE
MHYVNFCRALAVAVGCAVLLFAGAAFAHTAGVSRGDYVVTGDAVDATFVFRNDDLGTMTATDVVTTTRVVADGATCAGTFDHATPDDDGLRIVARYACGHAPIRRLDVHAGFLERLPPSHGHVATVVLDGTRVERLASRSHPDIEATPASGLLGFVRAGVEHILTGVDHLLFLVGLVLLRRDDAARSRERIKPIVWVLTAFTVGHSISLAVATLGGFAPSARIVEPLVALSVAYVGAENLYARAPALERRWLVTLPFGLVHGFAFASGLLLVRLPRAELPKALLGFNLGVELGQLAVMAIVLPFLFALARYPRIYDRARVLVSAGVLACGLVWFVQRLL